MIITILYTTFQCESKACKKIDAGVNRLEPTSKHIHVVERTHAGMQYKCKYCNTQDIQTHEDGETSSCTAEQRDSLRANRLELQHRIYGDIQEVLRGNVQFNNKATSNTTTQKDTPKIFFFSQEYL